jgi:hypothetical protein
VIVHVSMARYKSEADGRSKQANMEMAKRMTEALKEEIPSIKRIEVGINLLPDRGGFDTCSYSEYDDMDAARATIVHPAHDRLSEFLTEVIEVRNSVTYEVIR